MIDPASRRSARPRPENAISPRARLIQGSAAFVVYDVVVSGASLAGCASAILFARGGLSVALVDRNPDVNAYKVACTHFIQASATPTIRRLGLEETIEAAGGVRNSFDLWTRWGWIRWAPRSYGPEPAYGYSIRRQSFDPLIRRAAITTDGVRPWLGHTTSDVVLDRDRARVELVSASGARHWLEAPLVVGADGRDSAIAARAGLPLRRRRANRFMYWAYYRGLAPAERARFWHLDPEVGYMLPNDDRVTLIVAMPAMDKLPQFKADREHAFERFVSGLPHGPALEEGERISPILGRLDLSNVKRPPTARRIALIGDAALSCDPLPGVGCGWALQSAEWLTDAVLNAPGPNGDLTAALREYASRHRRETERHYAIISALSLAGPPRAHERLLLKAATRDEQLAARIMAHWQRRIPVEDYLKPSTFLRSVAVLGREATLTRAARSATRLRSLGYGASRQ